jgi:hypothetical protein
MGEITTAQSATLYVWEKETPFDVGNVLFVLGGQQPPTEKELRARNVYGSPMYCTPSMRFYHATRQRHEQETKEAQHCPETRTFKRIIGAHRGFSTAILTERLIKLGLALPDHELIFLPRGVGTHDNLDLAKIAGAAAYVEMVTRAEVLAVPGTSIEQDQLYASNRIAQRLGMAVVQER